jgi:hypothetical protein
MTEGLRRETDTASLAEINTHLALLEQAQQIETRLRESNHKLLEKSIEALTLEVRAANQLQIAANAEAVATPAGRAIVARLDKHDTALEENEKWRDSVQSFIDGFNGSLRGLRVALTGLSFVVGLLTVVTLVRELLGAAGT